MLYRISISPRKLEYMKQKLQNRDDLSQTEIKEYRLQRKCFTSEARGFIFEQLVSLPSTSYWIVAYQPVGLQFYFFLQEADAWIDDFNINSRPYYYHHNLHSLLYVGELSSGNIRKRNIRVR